jgi:ABC-type bacteriocin/lantibiotic exporter with double-glycine peptidase domain
MTRSLDSLNTSSSEPSREQLARVDGGHTWLAEGGGGLSGCQRQRLALALVHEPAVLILDEATSNLDVATEALVECSLRELACTRVVSAHRLRTVRDADLIIVLDQGAGDRARHA